MNSGPLSRPALLALCLSLILIWGSAFNFVGVAVDHISPFWLTAWRLVVGALFLTVYALVSGAKFPHITDRRWIWYGGLGLSGAVVPFLLMAEGQKTVDSGLTAVIVGAMPLITIVLAHFFTDEKLTLFKTLGFIIGFLGVAVLFLPDDIALGLTGDWKAQLLILGTAFCYAATTVVAKRAPVTQAAVGAAMMMMIASVAGLTSAVIVDPQGYMPNLTALVMILLLGFGATGVATILYLIFIERVGPSAMARLNYFPPVASVIFGVWFLNEAFTWKIGLAFAIIIFGVFVSRIRRSDPLTPQTDLPDLDQGHPRPPIPPVHPRTSAKDRD